MTTSKLPPRYRTQECRICGEQVLFLTVAGGVKVPLDPSLACYVRESDGEGGGNGVWAPVSKNLILARHKCVRREGPIGTPSCPCQACTQARGKR